MKKVKIQLSFPYKNKNSPCTEFKTHINLVLLGSRLENVGCSSLDNNG